MGPIGCKIRVAEGAALSERREPRHIWSKRGLAITTRQYEAPRRLHDNV